MSASNEVTHELSPADMAELARVISEQVTRDLADQVKDTMAARLEPDALMDAEQLGQFLGYTARVVREKLAPAPGFPRAIRIGSVNGSRGAPRWQRRDILAWLEKLKKGKIGGGRRKEVEWE